MSMRPLPIGCCARISLDGAVVYVRGCGRLGKQEGRSGVGCLLERSWNGTEALQLEGGRTRMYLQDGDTVALRAHCQGDGYRIGFGECTGTVLPARAL